MFLIGPVFSFLITTKTFINKPKFNILLRDDKTYPYIYFSLDHLKIDSALFLKKMAEKKIHFFELGPSWFRLVTHAGVSRDDVNYVVREFDRILS